jgi:hypothetical protein
MGRRNGKCHHHRDRLALVHPQLTRQQFASVGVSGAGGSRPALSGRRQPIAKLLHEPAQGARIGRR